MKNSKAGRKLPPIIDAQTRPLFMSNPRRYRRLCLWAWQQMAEGWEDEAIAKAVEMGRPYIDGVDNWWSYLRFLLPKAKAAAADKQCQDHKTEVGHLAAEFIEFLKARRAI